MQQLEERIQLVVGKGTVAGHPYHMVHPVIPFWNTNQAANQTWDAMVAWTLETFGPSNKIYELNQIWYVYNGSFWFLNEEDAIMFVLKWS
jgi:hypothetical protein